jgi:hypothetical protein
MNLFNLALQRRRETQNCEPGYHPAAPEKLAPGANLNAHTSSARPVAFTHSDYGLSFCQQPVQPGNAFLELGAPSAMPDRDCAGHQHLPPPALEIHDIQLGRYTIPEDSAATRAFSGCGRVDSQSSDASWQSETGSIASPPRGAKKQKRSNYVNGYKNLRTEEADADPSISRISSAEWHGLLMGESFVEYVSSIELKKMLLFILCQLRAECDRFLTGSDAFDTELAKVSIDHPGLEDCKGQSEAMARFLCTKAKGDKWVPFHAVLCDHERYIFENIYTFANLTERQRLCLAFAFRASSWTALFDHLYIPILRKHAEGDSAELDAILTNPEIAFERNGCMHQKYTEYRNGGGKLHTSSYSCHPPSGAKGEEYTFYIMMRTALYIRLGGKVYDLLEPHVTGQPVGAPLKMDELDKLLQSEHRVGPTTSKMFMVTIHLRFPQLGLLSTECQVGDGASAAFLLLFPRVHSKVFGQKETRQAIFHKMYTYILGHLKTLEPRLLPMIQWTANVAREKYAGIIHCHAFSDSLSAYDLQVNLCEWRKFRSM